MRGVTTFFERAIIAIPKESSWMVLFLSSTSYFGSKHSNTFCLLIVTEVF
jgi:hypothetical protein